MDIWALLLCVGAAVVLVATVVTLVWWSRHTSREPEPSCGRCGYAVRGLPSFTCPECGSDLREVGIRTATRRWLPAWAPGVALWSLVMLMVGTGVFVGVVQVWPKRYQVSALRTVFWRPHEQQTDTHTLQVTAFGHVRARPGQRMLTPGYESIVVQETGPDQAFVHVLVVSREARLRDRKGRLQKTTVPPDTGLINEMLLDQWILQLGYVDDDDEVRWALPHLADVMWPAPTTWPAGVQNFDQRQRPGRAGWVVNAHPWRVQRIPAPNWLDTTVYLSAGTPLLLLWLLGVRWVVQRTRTRVAAA